MMSYLVLVSLLVTSVHKFSVYKYYYSILVQLFSRFRLSQFPYFKANSEHLLVGN